MSGPTGRLDPAGDVVESALTASRADGCVVLVEDVSEAEVRFANSTVTTNGVRRSRRVTVVSVVGAGKSASVGVATRSGAVALEDVLAAAEAEARGGAAARDAAPLLGGEVDADFGQAPPETELAAVGGVVAGLPGAFDRMSSAGAVLAGFAQHAVTTTYLGVSTGLRRRHVQSTASLELVARAEGGANSAWVGVDADDLTAVSMDEHVAALERRLGWGKRRESVPAGRYDVVLPPSAVADLAQYLGWSMGGQDAEDGRTVFSKAGGGTRVGDALSTLPLELRSDPQEPGLGCAPFLAVSASSAEASVFDNGLARGTTQWIHDGRLAHLQYHRAGAEEHGVDVAAPGGNLVLELPGATGDVDALVGDVERGLLVTCLWYIRTVDPATLLLTGLTRDGVYLVERGEVTGAVNNFRFNESPVDLLARAAAVGAPVRALGREFGGYGGPIAAPPVRVGDFNMSTVSPAS